MAWSQWQEVQLQECLVLGISPEETAALLGMTKQEVCDKARELGFVFASETESPSTAPTLSELFPKHTAAS